MRLLRGGIIIRTHHIHKNLYITLFLLIIFGFKLWLLTSLYFWRLKAVPVRRTFFLYTVSAYACTSEYYTSSYVQMNPIPPDLSGDCMQQWYYNNIDSTCLLYTSPSPRDRQKSRMPSSA